MVGGFRALLDDNPPPPSPTAEVENDSVKKKEAGSVKDNKSKSAEKDVDKRAATAKRSVSMLQRKKKQQQLESQVAASRREAADPGRDEDLTASNEEIHSAHRRRKALNPSQSGGSLRSKEGTKSDGNDKDANEDDVPSSHRRRTALNPSKSSSSTRSNTSVRSSNSARSNNSAKSNSSSKDQQHDGTDDDSFVYRRRRVVVPSNSSKFQQKVAAKTGTPTAHAPGMSSSAATSSPTHSIMKTSKAETMSSSTPNTTSNTTATNNQEDERIRKENVNQEESPLSNNDNDSGAEQPVSSDSRRNKNSVSDADASSGKKKKKKKQSKEQRQSRPTRPTTDDDHDDGADADDDDDEAPSMPRRRGMTPTKPVSKPNKQNQQEGSVPSSEATEPVKSNKSVVNDEQQRPGTSDEASQDTAMAMPRRSLRSQKSEELELFAANEFQESHASVDDNHNDESNSKATLGPNNAIRSNSSTPREKADNGGDNKPAKTGGKTNESTSDAEELKSANGTSTGPLNTDTSTDRSPNNNGAGGNDDTEVADETLIQFIYTGEEDNVPEDVTHVVFNPAVTYVPEGAFSEHKTLRSVVIPSSVTEIGSQAFANCERLTSVTLSEGLQVISEFAFTGCTKLESIHIPSTLIALGQDSFFSCDHLKEVTLPQSQPKLENIRVNTFRRCKQLSEIKIPSSIKVIGNNAFDGCVALNKVEFAETVDGESGCSLELIGKESFIYCEALTSISIPSSVKEINKEAFFHCTSLKEVLFSTSGQLSKLGMNVFGSCTALEALTIPPSLVEIGESTFAGCESLTTVDLPKATADGGDGGKLSIIGFKAFSSCKSLLKIEIPTTVTSIGEQTFYDCESLHTIILPNTPDGPQSIQHFTFRACKALTSIEIPESVVAIGPEAFYECDALTTVKFNKGLRTIGESAFGACKGLANLDLPSTLEVLGKEAFFECTNLNTVTLNKGLLSIGESAFGKCKKLQFIDIPTSVEVIDKEAFLECEGLLNIKFRKGLKVIASKSFRCCKALTVAELPSSLEEIHGAAFAECDSLVTVTLPQKLDRIEKNAFRVCRNLKTIEIPPSVLEVASNAFYKCESLETLYLPVGLQVVGKAAFKSCKALTTTEFPSTITEVEETAFSGCNMLEKLPDMDYTKRFDGLPLHHLCFQVETNVVQFRGALEENPDTVNAKDNFGMTAMHVLVSCFNGSMEIFNVLLDAFPKAVTTKDARGRCPIHMAWNRRLWRTHVISALCTSDALAPDSDGGLPLDMAIRHDMPIHLQAHMFSLYPIHHSQLSQQECIPLLRKVQDKFVSDMLKNPPTSLDSFDRDKQHGWVKFVSGRFFEDSPDDIRKLVDFVNDEGKCSKQMLEALAYAKDRAGRQAIDFSHDELKAAFQQRLLFLGRYKLSEQHNSESGTGNDCNPVHRSEDCLVLFATDTFKQKDDEHHDVALKFTKDEDQFHQEIQNRVLSEIPHSGADITPEVWRFDDLHVVPLLRFHKSDISIANQNYIGCLVMPRGGRNLHQIIEAEGIAGVDLAKIVSIARDIAESLQYLHSNDILHGDFKPRNIVRFGDKMKLIDFHASVTMSTDGPECLLSPKCSTAYIPPEVAQMMLKTSDSVEVLEEKLQEYEKIKHSSPILWKEGLSEKYEEVNSLLLWLKYGAEGSLEAMPSVDVWSFGVILFFLLTGKHLIPCDTHDNLVDDADKKCLLSWKGAKEQQLDLILSNCVDATDGDKAEAQEVLRVCLEPQPSKRPFMDEVLNLVFFSERNLKTLRLLEARDEVSRSKEEFDQLASRVQCALQKPPEFFVDLNDMRSPFLFSIVGENEFIRQREHQLNVDRGNGNLDQEVSDSLDRAARFVSFARRVLNSGQRDGATIDWLYEKVYDDAAGRVLKVSYLQILCGLTLRPVITYKIDSKQHAPMLTKMAEWSGHMCAAAVQVASLFNTKGGVPRVFGYPLSSIGDDKALEVVSFRERILAAFPAEELAKHKERGSRSLELEELHNFIRDLEQESRVCQLFDDYNQENLRHKKWEDGLELGCVLEGLEARRIPTYVSRQYSKRLGGLETVIVPSVKDDEDEAEHPALATVRQLNSSSLQTRDFQGGDGILEELGESAAALMEEASEELLLDEQRKDSVALSNEPEQPMDGSDNRLKEHQLGAMDREEAGNTTDVQSDVDLNENVRGDDMQETMLNETSRTDASARHDLVAGVIPIPTPSEHRDLSCESPLHEVMEDLKEMGDSDAIAMSTDLSRSIASTENHSDSTASTTPVGAADDTFDAERQEQNSSFNVRRSVDGLISPFKAQQPEQNTAVKSPEAQGVVVEKKINDSPGAYTNRTFSDETPHGELESLREDIKQMLRSEVEAMQDEIISSLRKDMKGMGGGVPKVPVTDTSCKCKASCVIL